MVEKGSMKIEVKVIIIPNICFKYLAKSGSAVV